MKQQTWRLYHNPRCSKSREALAFLEAQGLKPEVVEYLRDPLPEAGLRKLFARLLVGTAADAVRVKDEGFTAHPFALDAATIARELAKRPELLERPIVENEKGAVVARPLSNVEKLF